MPLDNLFRTPHVIMLCDTKDIIQSKCIVTDLDAKAIDQY